MTLKWTAAIAAALALAASAAAAERNASRALYFMSTATIEDDDLETVAKIDTNPGDRPDLSLDGGEASDTFLRALVDKQRGDTVIQVYGTIMHKGDWRFYRSAAYQTDTGPKAVDAIDILQKVYSCAGSGGCWLREDVGFVVTTSELQAVASHVGEEGYVWRFKWKAQNGPDFTAQMSPDEAAGLLMAVDRFKAEHKVPGKPLSPI